VVELKMSTRKTGDFKQIKNPDAVTLIDPSTPFDKIFPESDPKSTPIDPSEFLNDEIPTIGETRSKYHQERQDQLAAVAAAANKEPKKKSKW
jgi:Pyruvate/2-oxoacid:ferredoxin oxidoreductase gamma subunit